MEVRQERSRWFTVTAAMAIIATSLMVSVVGGRMASGNGAPDPLTVSTHADHPGMMYVQWHQPNAEVLRLQWSSDGTNVSESVLVLQPGTSRDGIIIPNLPVGTYSVTTSVITWHEQSWHATQSAQRTVAVAAAAANCPPHPLPGGDTTPAILCGTLTGLPGDGSSDLYVYTDGSSSSMHAAGDPVQYAWAPPDGQPHTTWHRRDEFGDSPYMRARIQFLDTSASAVSQWWAAFGETGTRFDTATDVLVPMDPAGGPVRLDFDITRITDFITLEGEITKDIAGAAQQLAASDFERLCIQVFEATQIDDNERVAYSQVMCAGPQPGGFVDPTDGNRGKWRIKLPAGNYRLRFQDEANYYGDTGVLHANVKFAPEWCCGTIEARTERSGDASLLSTTTSGLNVALRPAKQLRVDVTDVPAEYATLDTWANVVVGDDFGNWTGGAMVTTSATTWGANVTGLVEGRAYKIFLQFSGNDSAPDRWWLVGGGTLEGAAGVVPGPVLTEPWQPAPYLVTLHYPDGSALGSGEGCVAVFPEGSSTRVASNCTNGQGEVALQRLLAGRYRVIAWTADGESALEVGEFVVTTTQSMSTRQDRNDHAVGIANTTALVGSLPGGYEPTGAVVMANATPPPPPFLVTIHQSNGAQIINGAACIEMEPVGGGTITGPACTDEIGIAVIGPVGAGDHTVRVTNAGSVALTYTVIIPDPLITFPRNGQTFALGLANTAALAAGSSLPDNYSPLVAVVLP